MCQLLGGQFIMGAFPYPRVNYYTVPTGFKRAGATLQLSHLKAGKLFAQQESTAYSGMMISGRCGLSRIDLEMEILHPDTRGCINPP